MSSFVFPAHLDQIVGSSIANTKHGDLIEELICIEEADIATYQSIYKKLGSELPRDFAQFLAQVGRIEILTECLDLGYGVGISGICTPFQVIEYAEFLDSCASAGVPNADQWIPFAFTGESTQGFWVFDKRFQSKGIMAVGRVNDDDICEYPKIGSQPLPFSSNCFDSWLSTFAKHLLASLETVDRDALADCRFTNDHRPDLVQHFLKAKDHWKAFRKHKNISETRVVQD